MEAALRDANRGWHPPHAANKVDACTAKGQDRVGPRTGRVGHVRVGTTMGRFQVQVTVANPQAPERSFREPFWVDTGALYSFAPEDRLHAIGIVPKCPRDFVFADGKKDRLLVGEAAFSIEGTEETITCLVVFGPPGSLLLLGAAALGNFGVQADPTTQSLRPITAVIGTAWAARATPVIYGAPSRRLRVTLPRFFCLLGVSSGVTIALHLRRLVAGVSSRNQ